MRDPFIVKILHWISSLLKWCDGRPVASIIVFILFFTSPYLIYVIILHIRSSIHDRKNQADAIEYIQKRQEYERIEAILNNNDVGYPNREFNAFSGMIYCTLATDYGRKIHNIYKALHDDLVAVFGEDYREKFPLPGIKVKENADCCPYNNIYWAAHLMLAHEGLVKYPFLGWDLGGVGQAEISIAMCKRIEFRLKERHPELGDACRIYLVTNRDRKITASFRDYDPSFPVNYYDGRMMLKYEMMHWHSSGVALW